MKQFTLADVRHTDSQYPKIYLGNYLEDLLLSQPPWMQRGLQETASGCGRRLNSGFKIHFEGKLYRVYTTIFSNVGSNWFKVKGRTIYVD